MRIFNASAEAYSTRKAEVDRRSHAAMLRLLRIRPCDRVLEVASGPGFVSQLLAEKAMMVAGIDLAPQKGEALRRQRGMKNLTFIRADAEYLPFRTSSFDAIACHKALHHFGKPRSHHQQTWSLRSGGDSWRRFRTMARDCVCVLRTES